MRRKDRTALEMIARLRWQFRQACIGSGVAIAVDAPIAGTGWHTPEVTRVQLGPPVRLTVRMVPGQIPAALQRAGLLVAPHLGGVMIRVEDRGHGFAVVTVLDHDPLAGVLELRLPRPDRRVLLGRDEGGSEITEDWRVAPHMVIQGVTRSGKSVLTYGLLAQLAGQPDVLVAGCDPTGLLWRPFTGTRHADWMVSGLGDLGAHDKLLTRLCEEMDDRIRCLPYDRDTIRITPERPALVVVLEELAGLLRAADAVDKDTGKRIRAGMGRLLAEGAKVGIRVIILVQRAEAQTVGAFERAMCSLRISFRTDNRASVELLHPGCDPATADAHTTAKPGIALLSAPGMPLTRIRSPYLGGYPQFAAAIAQACSSGDPGAAA